MSGRALATLGAVFAATLAVACASMQPPPGGPPDVAPPRLVAVLPESGAVGVNNSEVRFVFDEVISERPSGVTNLADLVLISPRTSEPRVGWHREDLTVKPRRGFRPNTAYQITLLPGIADLRGNVDKNPRTVIFSTGPTIPTGEVSGRIFDWQADRPAGGAMVEAFLPSDTTVVYLGVADSLGRFAVALLPPGRYLVRGYLDKNKNRALDRLELVDSARVEVAAAAVPSLVLLAALRDTLPPRISGVSFPDSLTLAVDYDRPLLPGQSLTPAQFRLRAPDSTNVPIARAAFKPTRDTTVRRDTTARRDTATVSRPRADTAAGRDTTARRDTSARADTLRARAVPALPTRPPQPPPPTTVLLTLGAPLKPGTYYRVSSDSVRSLTGRSEHVQRLFTTPRPAPVDTTRARGDTSARPIRKP